ncbi:MAG: hypothetical protein GX754_06990 [Clostridiaceae bacterium]|nr:hypothetical protein [Clostridiaceae bacterium]
MKTKRIFSWLLVIVLCLAVLSACSSGKKETDGTTAATGTGKPSEVEWEPATFSIWTWPGSIELWGAKDFNDVSCFQEAEKITNTKIEWVMQSDNATFDLIMASGDIPDGVYYAWSPVRQGQYAADVLIVDIMPYIKSSAPNLLQLIESDPLVKKQLVHEDGTAYLVPWLTTDLSLLAGEGFAIRKDWLDKFNLSVPKTPDELLNALMTFREQDANGNGKKDELVTGYPSQFNKSAFAFGTTDGFHLAEDGKTVVYGPMTDNYREWLRWMNKLYSNNLIDPDYFSWDYDLYMKKCMEDRVSLYVDNPGVLSTIMKDGEKNGLNIVWEPMEYMYYKGKSVNFSSAYKRYVQPYGVAFSKDVDNPERFMKWFDFWFTEEGNDLLNWGIKGVSYTEVGGKRQYTDTILKDPELVPSTALSKYAYPTFVGVQSAQAAFALADDFEKKCREIWAKTDISGAAEPFTAFTNDEQAINSQYSTDLSTIKDSWRDRFITGEKNVDTDWEEYINELKKYHVEDLIKINQAATDRYLKK